MKVRVAVLNIRRVIQRRRNEEPHHFRWDFVRNSTFVKGFEI
jgi:hypothetical protein